MQSVRSMVTMAIPSLEIGMKEVNERKGKNMQILTKDTTSVHHASFTKSITVSPSLLFYFRLLHLPLTCRKEAISQPRDLLLGISGRTQLNLIHNYIAQ